MAQFTYRAIDKGGRHIDGSIEAADRRSAVAALSGEGRFVTELFDAATKTSSRSNKEQASSLWQETKRTTAPMSVLPSRRISSKELTAMTAQFCTAIRAGLPLMKCLELLRDQQKKPALRALLTDLVQSVSSGQSLSDAMSKHPTIFSPLYLSMIRVGETGGILEETTDQLAQILKRDDKVKTSMKNASAYPIFVLCLGLVSVVIIVTWILPRVMATMDVDEAMLPWPTRVLLTGSHLGNALFTTIYGWIGLVLLVGMLFQLIRWIKTDGRLAWDTFRLKIPVLGGVLQTIAVGRFARTLGALTKGGVTILEALAVVRDTLGNEVLSHQIDAVAEEVKRGEPLATPLEQSGYFPPLLVQVVAVGEQTGTLDEMLLNAAETFDTEADAAITRFMAVFPAILILLLAIVVGFIIVATLLPMVVMQLGAVG